MPLSASQCANFNSFLGTRPYDWIKQIAKDRKPHSQVYLGMYATKTYPPFFGTTALHERVYVTRPNDPGIWTQFIADPCIGNPCDNPRQYISHGVDQLRFDRYRREYQTDVFCLDQLNTIEEGIQKIAAIVEGYKEIPEEVSSDFLRTLTLRKAGTAATGAGLFIAGLQDSYGNPISLDVSDSMFSVSSNASTAAGIANCLFINLNANGGVTALVTAGYLTGATTAYVAAAMGQLSMEYLANFQEDLAANGYHDKDWLMDGKFSVTVDATTRRRLLTANPALTQMYAAADFAKGGAFYSFGMTAGCGDWLFKEDKQQMRFRFRGDLDGKDLAGNSLTSAVWLQQVWPYENVAATFGKKPQFSTAWKNAPVRLYHAYNREARNIYVGDIVSVNDEMKFGLARDLMGKWTWKSPDFFQSTDPNTGLVCQYNNDKKNKGYWLGEYDLTIETIFPEIERVIFALGEPQPYVRVPRTNTAPNAPVSYTDYQQIVAYNALCGDTGGNYTQPYPSDPYAPED